MMALMNESNPTVVEIITLLQALISYKTPVSLDEKKQTLAFVDKNNATGELTFPLVFPMIVSGSGEEILQQIKNFTQTHTIVLIQAGAAAIGYTENGELKQHKVIKKYMVRKKQGKSQLNYFKSKGKSRLGSRIRLKNGILFFEEINETLNKWNVSLHSETILLSVPINFKNLLFTSKVPIPFEKKDPRIKKIPVDIGVPSFKELRHIHWMASRGTLKQH